MNNERRVERYTHDNAILNKFKYVNSNKLNYKIEIFSHAKNHQIDLYYSIVSKNLAKRY